MSDCRFGVSPVNYPDPDPDIGIVLLRDIIDKKINIHCELVTSQPH